jgi:hypothetical protein
VAELGCGVRGDFGLGPVGDILLDEDLGPRVVCDRLEHSWGAVGPGNFSPRSAEVTHLHRIYIPAAQPRIRFLSMGLGCLDGTFQQVMKSGRYRIFSPA